MAFGYDQPIVLIETNIRQFYIHHFLKDSSLVSEEEIASLVERTLPDSNIRAWYSALMDYGSHLKKNYGNMTQSSVSYKKQSRFKGSDREIRGRVLQLLSHRPLPEQSIQELTNFDSKRLDNQLKSLMREGLITHSKKGYSLPA